MNTTRRALPDPSPAAPRTPARPGAASALLLLLAAGALAGTIYFTAERSRSAVVPGKPATFASLFTSRVTDPPNAKTALRDAGVNAQTLAACGVTAEEVPGLLAAAAAYMAQHGVAYQNAAADVRTARQALTLLEPLAQSGRATQEQVSALSSARADLATASSTLATARAALVAAATAGLAEGKVSALATLRAARLAGASLPAQYLLTNRSEADTVALRDALAEARVCARTGEDVSQASQDLIAAANQEQATASAATSLSNLSSIQQAWNEYQQ